MPDPLTETGKGAIGRFVRQASVLGVSSLAAQGIALLATPILARMYAPEGFGFLGVVASVSAILATIMTLRLDTAIVAADDQDDARRLYTMTIGVSLLVTVVAAAGIAATGRWIWLLVPLVAWSMALQRLVANWWSRHRRIPRLAKLTLARGVVQSGSQLAFGAIAIGPIGLPLGMAIGGAVFAIDALRVAWRHTQDRRSAEGASWRLEPRRTLRIYRMFPMFSLPQGIMSEASQATAMLYFSWAYGLEQAGYYAAALRLSQLPVNVAARSIQQTLYGARDRDGSYRRSEGVRFARRLSGTLAVVALPVFGVVGWFAPQLVAWILGPDWQPSGPILRWLLVWLYVQLVASPAIALYRMHAEERAHFLQTFGLFVSRIVAVGVAFIAAVDLVVAVAFLAVVGAIWNGVMMRTAFTSTPDGDDE